MVGWDTDRWQAFLAGETTWKAKHSCAHQPWPAASVCLDCHRVRFDFLVSLR